jgi:hypothetical protein
MYIDILRLARDAVRKKRPQKRRNSSYLLHDIAPTHQSVYVKDISAKNNVTTLEHSLYLLTWLQLILPVTSSEISTEVTAFL